MSVGIVGNGVVGTAVAQQVDGAVSLFDPQETWEDHHDAYIIAVPTPAHFGGSLNMSYVEDVLRRIPSDRPVLIKSTITVDFAIWLKCHRDTVCFSPEFLTERNSVEDAQSENKFIIGGIHKYNKYWSRLFTSHVVLRNNGHIHECDIVEAAVLKLAENSMLAIKVSFANELYDLTEWLGVNFDNVIEGLKLDPRLGKSHWQVPGHDGQRGWGGKCFPKDSQALATAGRKRGVPFHTLEAAIKKNHRYRDEIDVDDLSLM